MGVRTVVTERVNSIDRPTACKPLASGNLSTGICTESEMIPVHFPAVSVRRTTVTYTLDHKIGRLSIPIDDEGGGLTAARARCGTRS